MNRIFKEFLYITPLAAAHDLYDCRARIRVCATFVILFFAVITFQMIDTSIYYNTQHKNNALPIISDKRVDILDRNGVLLATSLKTNSVYINPEKMKGNAAAMDLAIEKLSMALNISDKKPIIDAIKSGKKFVWAKRNITPKEYLSVNNLGIPGVFFERAHKRIYPHGNLFSHVVGYVNLDNNGIAGIEQYFNKNPQEFLNEDNKYHDITLSIDANAQYILHEEMAAEMKKNRAIGAAGSVIDVTTGEVIAMVSLPDFDPHNPSSFGDEKFNRSSLACVELGSIFKILTMATALDTNKTHLFKKYDVNLPFKIGRFSLKDFKGTGGVKTATEIFVKSSNIGTAKIGVEVGHALQKEYMKRFGMLDEIGIEMPEKAKPVYPNFSKWGEVSTITISYGYGMSVSPLHVARAAAAIVNGGNLFDLTLIKGRGSKLIRSNVIKATTSEQMRRLMRVVATDGTGRSANVAQYLVGAKTGTAEKVENGRYNSAKNRASCIGVFPIHKPKYLVIITYDEPKLENSTTGVGATGGRAASPTVGRIIERIAPILGVQPILDPNKTIDNTLRIEYKVDRKAL